MRTYGLASSFQNVEYEVLAEAAWDRSWGIINTEDSWKKEAGHDIYTGLVTARYFNDLGKVFRLQVSTV